MKTTTRSASSAALAAPATALDSVRRDNRRLGVQLAVLLVVVAVLPFTLVGDPFSRGVAQLAFVYVILSVSFQLLFGQAGLISFGHAAMFGVGAYISTILQVRLQVPMPLAWLAALVGVMVLAALIGTAILRLGPLFLSVVTLSLGEAIILLAAQLPVTGGEEGMPVPAILPGLGDQSLVDYSFAAIVMLIVVAITLTLPSTRYGREIRAVGDDPVAAESTGIPVRRRRIEIFVATSAMAAAAGIVYAHTARFIAPSAFGLDVSILVLAMVAVGGMKSIWGAIAGAVALTLLPEIAAGFAGYNVLIYGIVLVIIFRFAPGGLAGLVNSVVAFITRRGWRRTPAAGTKGVSS